MGLDRVSVYEFDANDGTLSPALTATVKLAPSAGPRHMDFRPDGGFAHVVNENDLTLTAFERDAETGHLTPTGDCVPVPAPVCLARTQCS